MLQNITDAEDQEVQCCCSSADTATKVFAVIDLHLLMGILLLGQPKQQVLGVTSSQSSSSAQVCKRAFSASMGLLSNRVLLGGLWEGCTSLPRTERKQQTGKIKVLLEEERLLLFLRFSVSLAWVLLPAGPG